jgi:Tfp pilus assembly protein PilV
MSALRHRSGRRESGLALPLVLLLLVFVAVVVTALLNLVFANLRSNRANGELQRRIQTVNGGLETAIQRVRGGSADCLQPIPTQVYTISSRSVEVRCTRNSSALDIGPGGWALYLNNADASSTISTQSAANDTLKLIKGPVYNAKGDAGYTLSADVEIQRGALVHDTADCSGAFPVNASKTVTAVGFTGTTCRNAPLPNIPAATLAQLAAQPAAALAPTNTGSCRRFSPGTYNAPPALNTQNWFAPGVYYFNFGIAAPVWTINQPVIVGAPSDGMTYQAGVTPCVPSPTSGPTVFVFGGNSRLEIANGGVFEIFSDPADPRAPNAAIVGHWIGAPAWIAAPSVVLPKILGFDSGTGGIRKLVVHGITYAPRSKVQLIAGNNGVAKLLSSVVVGGLDLKAPNSIDPNTFGIFNESDVGTSGNRFWARSVPIPGQEKELCGFAQVTISEDADELLNPPKARTVVTDLFRIDNRLSGPCPPP